MNARTPGLHPDITASQYHADKLCDRITLSRGLLVTLVDDCPLQAWFEHPRLGNQIKVEVNKKMDFGSMGHRMILDKGDDIVVCDAENWMTKAAKEFRDTARAGGKIPALAKDYTRATQVQEAFQREIERFGYKSQWDIARSEVGCLWEDNGVMCRCMFDRLTINEEAKTATIFDLKIGAVTNPRELDRHVFNQRYHIQKYFYVRGLEAVRPDLAGRVEYVICFLQDDVPFQMVPVKLNGEFNELAFVFVNRGMETWKKCLETKTWPGYADETVIVAPPGWAMAQSIAGQLR